jgi:N-acetylglucosaminyldiphosphoundecaprenol N-acetyl-beta-D-mannosaminyltransferase
MMGYYPARIEIMGAPIDPYTMEQTVSKTKDFVESGVFAHLAGVNADKLLQMRSDPMMDRTIRRCEIVNADGASMVAAGRKLGVDVPERVTGIDLMHELCRLSQSEGYRVFLLGATRDTVRVARRKLEESYPGLDICGIMDGYFDDEDFSAVGEEVASSRPDIVFVGITSPKKEHVIEHFRLMGLKGVYVGVGGSFDVISGSIPRAPLWMQRVGLEWLFRMMKEPRRLMRRYVVGNVRFIRLVSGEIRAKKKGGR